MWMILGISVLSVAVVIERIFFFAASSSSPDKMQNIFDSLADEASAPLAAEKSSLHRLFFMACEHGGLDGEKLNSVLEGEIRRTLYEWERHLSILEIAARVAPLLGLLGTVLGMVEMFGSMSVGGAIDARAVTGGIWKALFTTVAGLSVAIPVLLAHGFLMTAVDKEEETLERGARFIMDKRRKQRNPSD